MKTLNKLKLFMIAFIAIISIGTTSAQCTAIFSSPNYTLVGSGISFNTSGTSNYDYYSWDFGDGFSQTGTTGSNTSHIYSMSGIYNVCFTIVDSITNCTNIFCDSIIVDSAQSCFSSFTSIDNGNLNYSFNPSTAGVAPFIYSWTFHDGGNNPPVTSALMNPSFTYPSTWVTKYVSLSVTDATGCVSYFNDTILISTTACNYIITVYDSLGSTYFETDGTNGWSNGSSYFWDFGDGTTYSSSVWSGYSHVYSSPGTYYYCITIDSCPPICDSIVVSYTNNLCNINAGFTTTDNGNGNYLFTNTSTGTIINYLWNFGDGISSTATNPNHTFLANGTYTVVLSAQDLDSNFIFSNNCYDSETLTIVVTGVTNPVSCNAGFVAFADSSLFNGVIVINSSTGNNLTYFWDFGDGNTSTQQYPTYVYSTAGPFLLCLTVDNGSGCTSTYCDSIGSNGIVFKQSGFTINVQAPVVTGIKTQVETFSNITLYPNPVKDNLTISLNLNEANNVEVFVTDMLGNIVGLIANQQMNSGNNQLRWSTNNVPNGIYLLNIKTANSLEVKKLIVNK